MYVLRLVKFTVYWYIFSLYRNPNFDEYHNSDIGGSIYDCLMGRAAMD